MNPVYKFRCAECDKPLKSKSDVAYHIQSLHKGHTMVSCRECTPISWMKRSSVNQHRINAHGGLNTVKKLNIPKIGIISFQKPPKKSNPATVNQNPQQKINIKMISMMKSFSMQQNPESKTSEIVKGTSKPAEGTKTIIIEDETTPVSNKTANKQALIAKLLKQQLDRTVNNSGSSTVVTNKNIAIKENLTINSNAAKNENSVKPNPPEGKINLAKYIKPTESFQNESSINEKSKSIENMNIAITGSTESFNDVKSNEVKKSDEIMTTDIKKTKKNKLKESKKNKLKETKKDKLKETRKNKLKEKKKLKEFNKYKQIESTTKQVESIPKQAEGAANQVKSDSITVEKDTMPEKLINLAKYIKPPESLKNESSISEKSKSVENMNIAITTSSKNVDDVKRKEVEKLDKIMSSSVKKTKKNKLKEKTKDKLKETRKKKLKEKNKLKEFNKSKPVVRSAKQVESLSKQIESAANQVESAPKWGKSDPVIVENDKMSEKFESLKFIKVNFKKGGSKIVDMPKEEIPQKLGKRKLAQPTKASISEKRKKIKYEAKTLRRSGRLSKLNESKHDNAIGSESSILEPDTNSTKENINNNDQFNKINDHLQRNLQRETYLKFEEEINQLWNEEMSRDHPSSCHCSNCLKCKGQCCDSDGVRSGKCCDPQTLGKCINPTDIYCYAPCCSYDESEMHGVINTAESLDGEMHELFNSAESFNGEWHGVFNAAEIQPLELLNPVNLLVSSEDFAWAETVIDDGEKDEAFEEEFVDPYYNFSADNLKIEEEKDAEVDMWNNENSLLFRIMKLECESKTEVSKRLIKPNKNKPIKAKFPKKKTVKDTFSHNTSKSASKKNDVEKAVSKQLSSKENKANNYRSRMFAIKANKTNTVKKSRFRNIVDCHDWKDGGSSLPSGWKICTEYRNTDAHSTNKASDTYYLSPNLDFFRSRKKVLEYLKHNNAPKEDLELVKNGYGNVSSVRNQWTYDTSSHASSIPKPDLSSSNVSSLQKPDLSSSNVSSLQKPDLSSSNVSSPQKPDLPPSHLSSPQMPDLSSSNVSNLQNPDLSSSNVSSLKKPDSYSSNVSSPPKHDSSSYISSIKKHDSSSYIRSLQKNDSSSPSSRPQKTKQGILENKINPSMKDILNSIVIEDDSDNEVTNDMDTSDATVDSPLLKNLQETISNLRKKSEDWIKGDNRLANSDNDTKEALKNAEVSDNTDFVEKYKKAKEDCKETIKRIGESLKNDNNISGNPKEATKDHKIEECLKSDNNAVSKKVENTKIDDNSKKKDNVEKETLPELPAGWTAKYMDTQSGRQLVYISPNGIKFKSAVKVLNFLNSLKTSRKDIKMFQRIIMASHENGKSNTKKDNSLKFPILNKIKFKM